MNHNSNIIHLYLYHQFASFFITADFISPIILFPYNIYDVVLHPLGDNASLYVLIPLALYHNLVKNANVCNIIYQILDNLLMFSR